MYVPPLFIKARKKNKCETVEILIRNFWYIHITKCYTTINAFSSVQSLSHVRLFAAPWTAACQASLSITNSQNLLETP